MHCCSSMSCVWYVSIYDICERELLTAAKSHQDTDHALDGQIDSMLLDSIQKIHDIIGEHFGGETIMQMLMIRRLCLAEWSPACRRCSVRA